MTRISEVHPTVTHSLTTVVKILEASIELRQKEIDTMRACIISCQRVMADNIMPATEQAGDLETELSASVEEALSPTKLQVAMRRAGDK